MILSLEHNFIFVHVPKTAGSAMTKHLEPLGLPQTRPFWRSLSRKLPTVEKPGKAYLRQHDTALKIMTKLSPEVFHKFHRFAVVRNPYDHAVSHYEFMKTYRHKKYARAIAGLDFEGYLHYRMQPAGLFEKTFVRLPNQSYYLTDPSGEMLVNRVMKFETLDTDWADLTAFLKLPSMSLARINQSQSKPKNRSYQSYYNDTTKALVDQIYDADFARFGYDRDL